MITSNTYQFGDNTQLDDLIREAYERIGIIGNVETGLHLQSALLSGNLELATWPGKGLNLWMVRKHMLALSPNQAVYTLPSYTVRVLEVVASSPTFVTQNGLGTPISSDTQSGNAANCFNQYSNVGWTSTTNNGAYIGYNFGTSQSPPEIFYIGVWALTNSAPVNYQLAIEYALGDGEYWNTALTTQVMDFTASVPQWFVIENPVNARFWRIRKVGGSASNLAIRQLYLAQPPYSQGPGDRMLSTLSRSEWMSIANKMEGANQGGGFPSGYYFDERIPPTITMWPVPDTSYTTLLYTNFQYAQDMTALFQNADVPPRFYDALVAGLAARLAIKFAWDRQEVMTMQAEQAYQLAAKTDYENVPIRFQPDFNCYGSM